MKNRKKLFAITMGCPAGIGPEIILKLFHQKKINLSEIIIIGEKKILDYTNKKLNLNVKLNYIYNINELLKKDCLNILDLKNIDLKKIKFGKVSKLSGKASLDYIIKAVSLAKKKK